MVRGRGRREAAVSAPLSLPGAPEHNGGGADRGRQVHRLIFLRRIAKAASPLQNLHPTLRRARTSDPLDTELHV
jgi:hypothetical protein